MKNKQNRVAFIVAIVVLFLVVSPVLASDGDYSLVFKREFGVGLPGAVQGRMSVTIKGDLDAVDTVAYMIDAQEMAVVTAQSLKFQFNTDDYPAGEHSFYALVTTKTGELKQTAPIMMKFIAADEARTLTRNVFLGIGAILLVVVLAGVLLAKRQVKASKAHGVSTAGLWGAAVCPKCGRAFTRTLVGLNLLFKRYEPCPHCGKWSVTQRATAQEVDQAERKLKAAIAEDLPESASLTERDDVLDQLEESKYTEL